MVTITRRNVLARSEYRGTSRDKLKHLFAAMKSAVDWAIVGGGLHGVHIAARLVKDARVSPERIKIIDHRPRGRLLDRVAVEVGDPKDS